MSSPSDVLLSLRDVGVHYDGRPAIAGVDLEVRRGRVTALIGPSGCGKSSLLFALNRLSDGLAGCRVEGSLRLGGEELLRPDLDRRALRRRVGMVFQKPNPFPLSIARNLALPLLEHGCPPHDVATRSEEVLRRVGLWDEVHDRLDASATALSGGQQQRLCIARALTLGPELLLMDEPCSALDPLATDVVERLILSLRGDTTLIVVTHNLAQARRLADDVAVVWMQSGVGRVLESGPAQRVFESPREPDTQAYVSGLRG